MQDVSNHPDPILRVSLLVQGNMSFELFSLRSYIFKKPYLLKLGSLLLQKCQACKDNRGICKNSTHGQFHNQFFHMIQMSR